jgi:hypothetical protein
MDTTAPFPLDWHAWRAEWDAWRQAHADHLKSTVYKFEGRNVMTDEVLGVWHVNGRNVELSEVYFGVRDPVRYIGITFGTAAGCDRPEAPLVASFAELEHELGID